MFAKEVSVTKKGHQTTADLMTLAAKIGTLYRLSCSRNGARSIDVALPWEVGPSV
jgi:hypothetical protein